MMNSVMFALAVFAVVLTFYVVVKYSQEEPTGGGPVPYRWRTLPALEKEPERGDLDGDE